MQDKDRKLSAVPRQKPMGLRRGGWRRVSRGEVLAVVSLLTDIYKILTLLLTCRMFALLLDANSYVNTINTWAEPHNANGVTPNSIIDSNDEPPCNNQQRMIQRGY